MRSWGHSKSGEEWKVVDEVLVVGMGRVFVFIRVRYRRRPVMTHLS